MIMMMVIRMKMMMMIMMMMVMVVRMIMMMMISPGVAEKLLQSTMTWYKSPDHNLGHIQLACHLLTIFADTQSGLLTSKVAR